MHFGAMFFTDYSMSAPGLARALEERGFESVWAPEHKSPAHATWLNEGNLPRSVAVRRRRIRLATELNFRPICETERISSVCRSPRHFGSLGGARDRVYRHNITGR